MATAVSEKDHVKHQERKSSYELLPPEMSELRVVLLGNSWSDRGDVGNVILGGTVFDTHKAPACCLRVSGQCKWKNVVLINSPDLVHPSISEDKLMELIENCVRLSAPGPHVFLLVLQPEDFTEQHRLRLQTVLENFGERSFEQSLVLIAAPREERSGSTEKQQPPLRDMIRMCRYRYLRQKELELQELLIRLGQIVRENNGEYVSWDSSEAQQQQKPQEAVPVNMDPGRAAARGLRVVLFGKSEEEKTTLGNFIMRKKHFNLQRFAPSKQCESAHGEWREELLTVIKTPDVFSLSVETVRDEMRSCVSLCRPGPNVLLLVVKPADFTEENRKTLEFILSLFGPDAFKHSLVVSTYCHQWKETSVSVTRLLQECGGRHYNMFRNDHNLLMKKIEKIVDENQGAFLSTEEPMRPKLALNLVVCGRRGAGKTSAAKTILGQTELHSVSNSPQCVKHQAEVCGRQVSLVELPALYGKPLEAVMEESLRCISLCGPEGVHAFILVLPVAPLTDEDKGELESIWDTFGSRVKDFTVILFTVESDPTAPAVVNFVRKSRDIQELSQSCGGRCVVLSIKDGHQVSELLHTVDTISAEGSRCFTQDMFTRAQIETVTKLTAELQNVTQGQMGASESREPLRMVLMGRTGCGKSSTANTILGEEHFKPRVAPKPPITSCETAAGETDGHPVVVVKTPDLFDMTLSEDEFQQEVTKCISTLAPGPHVILLLLQIGNFTPEEKDSVELIKKYFGKKSVDFTMIIFTRGDELHNRPFDSYLLDCPDFVKQLINECGGRFQVFNNKDETDRTQVHELMGKVDAMVKGIGSGCYRTEMLYATEELRQIQTERIMEEAKRKEESLRKMYEEDLRKQKIKISELTGEIEKERKLREKQLKDKDNCFNKEREERKKEREEEEKRRKKQEEALRQDWRRKLDASEKRVESEREQAEKKLEQSRREMKREREAWDKEKKDMWERMRQELRQNLEEEKTSHRKLQDRYHKTKILMCSLVALLLLVLLYIVFLSPAYTQTAESMKAA